MKELRQQPAITWEYHWSESEEWRNNLRDNAGVCQDTKILSSLCFVIIVHPEPCVLELLKNKIQFKTSEHSQVSLSTLFRLISIKIGLHPSHRAAAFYLISNISILQLLYVGGSSGGIRNKNIPLSSHEMIKSSCQSIFDFW